MAASRCLGARAAGPRLLLVAWVVVASSTASVATRIAGSYRKQRATWCRCLRPKKAKTAICAASVDRPTSLSKGLPALKKASYTRLGDVGGAERVVKASRSACCAVYGFWPGRRRVQEGDLQGTSTDARLNPRRHGGTRIAVSKPRERVSSTLEVTHQSQS